MDKQSVYVYLYELPKSITTSVRIAEIIKKQTGYDLQEPVQFRDCRPLPNGLESPFQMGIIKIEAAQAANICKNLKYFEIQDGTDEQGKPLVWNCRALPFDRELLGANKIATNTNLNVFVKKLDSETTAKDLDNLFNESFGEVKSAKVSISIKTDRKGAPLTQVATSNGYGFVCFQNQEAHDRAVASGNLKGFEILRYQPKDPREIRKSINNIYVKNFNPSWDEAKLREVFSRYGDIKSLVLMAKPGKDGVEKKFAFVCYERPNDKTYGPECANKAVTDLNDQEIDGFKIYVQHALPATARQAQVKQEQFRYKNSKKKCNLFVKNFPASFDQEKLRALFQPFGEIESIIIHSRASEDGAPDGANNRVSSRAFVCFKQPDQAMAARANLHNMTIDNKQLYVVNYELPETRKKAKDENRDRVDFYNSRKTVSTAFDTSLFSKPETFQLIQQVIMLLQRNQATFGGNRYNQQRQDGQGGYNRGPRQQRNPSAPPHQQRY